jgi:hypothetical protein
MSALPNFLLRRHLKCPSFCELEERGFDMVMRNRLRVLVTGGSGFIGSIGYYRNSIPKTQKGKETTTQITTTKTQKKVKIEFLFD